MNPPVTPVPGSTSSPAPPAACQHTGDTLLVTLAGEIDAVTGPRVVELLRTRLTGVTRHVVVDLAQVDFIDVAGLRGLLTAVRLVTGHGATAVMRDPRPHIRWLLRFTDTAPILLDEPQGHPAGPGPAPVRNGSVPAENGLLPAGNGSVP